MCRSYKINDFVIYLRKYLLRATVFIIAINEEKLYLKYTHAFTYIFVMKLLTVILANTRNQSNVSFVKIVIRQNI